MASKKKGQFGDHTADNDPGLEIGLSGKHPRLIPLAHASTLTAVPGFSCCLLITKTCNGYINLLTTTTIIGHTVRVDLNAGEIPLLTFRAEFSFLRLTFVSFKINFNFALINVMSVTPVANRNGNLTLTWKS